MILVTGASGLLGSSILEAIRQQGREAVGMCHRHSGILEGSRLLCADLTDEFKTQRIFAELKPTIVIHCAAETNVDWCQEHRAAAEAINATATRRIAEISAKTRSRMLYVSTDSVFDGARGQYRETDIPAPMNVYAETKLLGEKEVLQRNPLAAVARTNVYGWNPQPKLSLAEWILRQLALGNPVPGFTDITFCPLFADDLAQILLAMLDEELVGLYHVAGSEAITKFEFARRVASTFGFDPENIIPARVTAAGLKAPRPRNTSLNTDKICAGLKRSMPDVDAGLRRFSQSQTHKGMQFARLKAEMPEVRS
jgi:dTDP-4-dehydrorhamnose reductase